MRYTEPRFTKELDLWVEASEQNAPIVFRALAAFGAPLAGVRADGFAKIDLIYQLGVAPIRIDVLTSITGVNLADAWQRRSEGDFGGVPAQFIGLQDLVRNKRATGRTMDLADCERLDEAGGR
jgi:hypothetical protein